MMARDPAERYQTSRDLLRDVVRLRDSLAAGPGTAMAIQPAAVTSSVEPVPVATPRSGTNVAAPTAMPGRRWQKWLPLAIVGSLVVALSLGAVVAPEPPPRRGLAAAMTGAEVPADGILNNKKRKEEGLLAAIDSEIGKPEKLRAGFELCMELAIHYFEEHKLDGGKKFFTRLEHVSKPPAYSYLGRLCQAIALALESKPHESNSILCDLARLPPREALGKRQDAETKRNFATYGLLVNNADFTFWIAEAVRYNQHQRHRRRPGSHAVPPLSAKGGKPRKVIEVEYHAAATARGEWTARFSGMPGHNDVRNAGPRRRIRRTGPRCHRPGHQLHRHGQCL